MGDDHESVGLAAGVGRSRGGGDPRLQGDAHGDGAVDGHVQQPHPDDQLDHRRHRQRGPRHRQRLSGYDVAEAVRAKSDTEPQVVNTICSATRDRQDAARALAGEVDVFYVIGGRHSSNSVKLLAVCEEQCKKSFLIETPAEINPADIKGAGRVGVTAGASTPNWLIEQVVQRLHEIGEPRAKGKKQRAERV